MKTLTRDVTITLMVKLLLLIALWFLCVKTMDKPNKDPAYWLLGQKQQSDRISDQLISRS